MTNAEKLTAWLDDRGIKRKWMAGQVPCDQTTLFNWCKGATKPMPLYADRIEALTNGEVKAGEW